MIDYRNYAPGIRVKRIDWELIVKSIGYLVALIFIVGMVFVFFYMLSLASPPKQFDSPGKEVRSTCNSH